MSPKGTTTKAKAPAKSGASKKPAASKKKAAPVDSFAAALPVKSTARGLQAEQPKTALVIGGGAGGLASALLLQANGYRVTVLEKNERVGGKLGREEIDGYSFDTGPSILTLPAVLRELFRLSGARLEDYLELMPLDPQWRCFFPDGFSFDFRSGQEAMCEEIARFAPSDVDGFRRLCAKAREMYRISEDHFFFRDIGGVVDLIRDGEARGVEILKIVSGIEPLKSYSQLIEAHIKHPQLKQALEHLTQYVGSSPFLSPAILGCLLHVQFEKGCWYPKGGMGRISEVLEQRFRELGGEMVCGAEVTRVYEDGRSLRGVETADGKLWSADEYIANMDLNSFGEKMGRKGARASEMACSGVTVFLGLQKKVQGLAHHNFFFSKDPKREFRDLYERRKPSLDPTVYACVPSLSDPSVAPAGRENLFLLVHAPVLGGSTDWDSYLSEYVALTEAKMAKMGFDVNQYGVELRKARSPKDIGLKWGTYLGNIYGQASHGLLKGGFKTANGSREFRNLQWAGGTVNPGAGVPMSIMSGMIASSNLLQKSRSLAGLRL